MNGLFYVTLFLKGFFNKKEKTRESKEKLAKEMSTKKQNMKANNQVQVNWPNYSTDNTLSLPKGALENNLRNLVGILFEVARPLLEDLINNIISSQQTTQVYNEPADELISVEEAAVILGVTTVTIHSWKKKKFISFKKIGRRVYFFKKELLAYDHTS